jgi:hypothetical protein
MSYIVESIEYKKCHIELVADDNPESPREWCNVGTMLCRHSRYNLGDGYKNGKGSQPSAEEILEITKRNDVIWLPLYLYDHSGLSIRAGSPSGDWTSSKGRFVGDGEGWDTSTVGIIYCTKEQVLKEWGKKRYTKALEEKAIKCLQGEVENYDNFLRGDVVGFVAKDPDGEQIDSCWGFYPDDSKGYGKRWEYPISEAKAAIDSWVKDNKGARFMDVEKVR